MTPTQAKGHERHRSFHAAIARRAALVEPKQDRSYVIPNTPFGIPKRHPEPPKPPRNIEPDYWHLMWFHDLVFGKPNIETTPFKIEDIYRAVARDYGVSKLDLLSSRRTKDVVRPRQVAMYLAKILTGRSLPEIARRMGGRDHTTALHSVRKIERLVQTDVQLAARIEKIKASL